MQALVFCVLLLFAAGLWGDAKKEIKSFVTALSKEQSMILNKFFNALIKDSFSGYVLYGDKPISIESYPVEIEALSGVDEKTLCILKGAEFWQTMHLSSENKAYLFLNFDAKNGYKHLICINRKAFLKAVNQNLSLFRYILGPMVTPENLLIELVEAKDQFYDVLKNDNVLLGILLGYGTQNALLVSRKELISNAFESDCNEKFPFLCKTACMHLPASPNILCAPSIGFNCLADEREGISQKVVVSRSLKPFDSCKIPHFACEPSSQESKALIATYEMNRKQILKAAQANDCLEKTLLKLLMTTSGKLDLPTKPSVLPLCLPQDHASIARRLADIIHREIEAEKYFQEGLTEVFLQGMRDVESSVYIPEPSQETHRRLFEISLLEKDLERAENLEQTRQYFHNLRSDQSVIELVADKLYFKVLQQGEGASASPQIKYATLHYSFQLLGESELRADTVKNEPVEQFIPGISRGLLGMKRGEIKQLYIHPEYGYGEDSYLAPNLPIIATIELIDFKEDDLGVLLAGPLKTVERNREDLLVKYRELQKKQFYINGANFWSDLKKGGGVIDFKTFELYFTQKALKPLCGNEVGENPPLSNDTQFLTDLQWVITTGQKIKN